VTVPSGFEHVGWIGTIVGAGGIGGCALTVMFELGRDTHAGEAISRAVRVWIPIDTKVNVGLAWYVPRSREYSY
jgi:hypothetical protein